MKPPWYVTAAGAALIWGIHYPLVDHALKRISLTSVLLLTAMPEIRVAPLFYRALAAYFTMWEAMDIGAKGKVLALAPTSLLGSVFLSLSSSGNNATLAGLIAIIAAT